MKKQTGILGGGLAATSLAYFLKEKTTVIEKEKNLGGLCSSHDLDGIFFDTGPHIIFSKNEKILNLMSEIVETRKLRRNNKIFFKGRFVKYPFENELSALPEEDKKYCLESFLENKHSEKEASNMLDFFLKTFGEGITELYLKPYNEKIWKYDPKKMNTKMVERIPQPPKEDIINSAKGIPSEGYLHQLYFYYPKEGGIQSLVEAFFKKAGEKASTKTGFEVKRIRKEKEKWVVEGEKEKLFFDELVNTMPLHELFKVLQGVPENVLNAVENLKYNSIIIVCMICEGDALKDYFAVLVPEKSICFHRLSKASFFGKEYEKQGHITLMAEITFRKGDKYSRMSENEILELVKQDLEKEGFVKKKDVVNASVIKAKYAYVIYDLDHKKNQKIVLDYLNKIGLKTVGRFAEFEYYNMDKVIERAEKLAQEINS
jgi:protoporphyrinogen oxidase